MLDLDNMEIVIEKEISNNLRLLKRIEQLETVVMSIQEDCKKEDKNIVMKEKNLLKKPLGGIPDHLSHVSQKYLPLLNGFSLRIKSYR